jgi:hypothetical protein
VLLISTFLTRGAAVGLRVYRDGILGHQFDRRLESFVPCYSNSLLLAVFTENYNLLGFSKSIQKNPRIGVYLSIEQSCTLLS